MHLPTGHAGATEEVRCRRVQRPVVAPFVRSPAGREPDSGRTGRSVVHGDDSPMAVAEIVRREPDAAGWSGRSALTRGLNDLEAEVARSTRDPARRQGVLFAGEWLRSFRGAYPPREPVRCHRQRVRGPPVTTTFTAGNRWRRPRRTGRHRFLSRSFSPPHRTGVRSMRLRRGGRGSSSLSRGAKRPLRVHRPVRTWIWAPGRMASTAGGGVTTCRGSWGLPPARGSTSWTPASMHGPAGP
jgi:hypothetical protein